jgi:hypothetical protein
VKRFQGKNGEDRIWLETSEIEQIAASELAKARLAPTAETPVVDIEAFIERHLKATLDQHADLEPTVLGVTEFFSGKRPKISINRDLTGSALDEGESPPGVLGRWRATLAHEAGHVLLHRCLYEVATGTMNLFREDDAEPQGAKLHRCLKRDATYASSGDWREVQANQAMAALLMPRALFMRLARDELGRLIPGVDLVPAGGEARIATAMAHTFKVSRQALPFGSRQWVS